MRRRQEREERQRAKVVEIGEDGVVRIKKRVDDEGEVEVERLKEYIEKAVIPVQKVIKLWCQALYQLIFTHFPSHLLWLRGLNILEREF